jgi:hypothetical protein
MCKAFTPFLGKIPWIFHSIFEESENFSLYFLESFRDISRDFKNVKSFTLFLINFSFKTKMSKFPLFAVCMMQTGDLQHRYSRLRSNQYTDMTLVDYN